MWRVGVKAGFSIRSAVMPVRGLVLYRVAAPDVNSRALLVTILILLAFVTATWRNGVGVGLRFPVIALLAINNVQA